MGRVHILAHRQESKTSDATGLKVEWGRGDNLVKGQTSVRTTTHTHTHGMETSDLQSGIDTENNAFIIWAGTLCGGGSAEIYWTRWSCAERGVCGRLIRSNWSRRVVVVVSEARWGGRKLVEESGCAGF